ncbi:hypothetical protein [Xanthomonas hortorum]|uniref:Uncharacterized protein n=1 Tax=Xanthomonas hortorum pv. gardneri TaxID=2754056 RepID=A0A6V7DB54_9XANT|nr:hypothetical protein [Xanthomonas hortorum]APP80710.1 hypothetical protein BJD10_14255 [Xanthomonas hortorum pv. gardneri]EGD19288.1 hypothetical protein XGA_2084 [Xanthomonas hortorum ATCC 19865]KLA95874.1 hypothetical protein SM19410_14060 [Xanthomonas hortorum pv. gardneri]KLA99815.1 hypothetical protein SM17710_08860 [Xanthomonas hortorum pv. gardneri]KLB03687.1 hypothetical protein SM18210_10195 [Xanthomonas hortorum pv. gardneri]
MRDDKDPGTLEMQLPKRRGRPPINGVSAQSAADHSRAYRQRRKAEQGTRLHDMSDMALVDAIRKAVSEGNAALIVGLATQLRYRYD